MSEHLVNEQGQTVISTLPELAQTIFLTIIAIVFFIFLYYSMKDL